MIKRAILVLVLIISAVMILACSESSFSLATESRLPKWFTVSHGQPRDHYRVTLDYYVSSSGRYAELALYDADSFFAINKVKGVLRGLEPLSLYGQPQGASKNLPSYEIITVDGVTDIIEHRQQEPIFYMVDDPVVWKELGVDKK